jgi:hypothetical protein
MLHDFEEMPDEAAIAVLQHHERLDGSGYPYRLSGYRIGKVSALPGHHRVSALHFLSDTVPTSESN